MPAAGAIQPWQSGIIHLMFHFRDDFPSYESLWVGGFPKPFFDSKTFGQAWLGFSKKYRILLCTSSLQSSARYNFGFSMNMYIYMFKND
jgi:hypothetical protein